MILSLNYVNSEILIILLLFQFYRVYLVVFGVSLLGVWILNIALYASVKQRPRLTGIGRNNSTYEPTNPNSEDNIRNQAPVGKKSRTKWVSLITFGKRFCTAKAPESTVVTRGASHEQFCRKQLELSLAKTVRYVVAAFTLALLPIIVILGYFFLNSVVSSDFNFNLLRRVVLNGFSHLAARILFSNSFVNCVIYSYRNKNFRIGLKNSFVCFIKK